MGTITGKFHQNALKTVGGVAETRLCPDGRTDGQMDGPTQNYSPLRLTSGDKKGQNYMYIKKQELLQYVTNAPKGPL